MNIILDHPLMVDGQSSLPMPPPRLALKPADAFRGLLDGAWWPRSRDLTRELPALIDTLDRRWARVTRVVVHPSLWLVIPRRVHALGHVVHVGWFAEQDPNKLMLLSYFIGRLDLLVIPPECDLAAATRMMAAAGDPRCRRPRAASWRTTSSARLSDRTAEGKRTGSRKAEARPRLIRPQCPAAPGGCGRDDIPRQPGRAPRDDRRGRLPYPCAQRAARPADRRIPLRRSPSVPSSDRRPPRREHQRFRGLPGRDGTGRATRRKPSSAAKHRFDGSECAGTRTAACRAPSCHRFGPPGGAHRADRAATDRARRGSRHRRLPRGRPPCGRNASAALRGDGTAQLPGNPPRRHPPAPHSRHHAGPRGRGRSSPERAPLPAVRMKERFRLGRRRTTLIQTMRRKAASERTPPGPAGPAGHRQPPGGDEPAHTRSGLQAAGAGKPGPTRRRPADPRRHLVRGQPSGSPRGRGRQDPARGAATADRRRGPGGDPASQPGTGVGAERGPGGCIATSRPLEG